MKIRTDFVTNSSSSSFVVEIKFTLTSGETVNFRGNGATSESGIVDYFASEAIINVSPQELGTAANVEELILLLTKGVIDDCWPKPIEIFAKPYPLSNSINGKKHDAYNFVGRIRKKIHSMEDIQAIEIAGSERNQHQYFQQIYRYDRTTGRYTGLLDGEEIDEIDGEHGGQLRFSTVGCLFSGEDDYSVTKGYTENAQIQWEKFNPDDFIYFSNKLWTYHGHAKYIAIPDTVKDAERALFMNNCDLIAVKYPAKMKSSSSPSFLGCKNLVSIILPKNLKTIGHDAFTGCVNLQYIEMPDTITGIGAQAFVNCPKYIPSVPREVIRIDESAFAGRYEIIDAIFDDTVKYIRTNAFADCTGLRTLQFHKGVEELGNYAFKNCTALHEVYIAGNQFKKLGKNIFEGCPNVVIHGLSGTMMEEYTKANGIPFVPIVSA